MSRNNVIVVAASRNNLKKTARRPRIMNKGNKPRKARDTKKRRRVKKGTKKRSRNYNLEGGVIREAKPLIREDIITELNEQAKKLNKKGLFYT